MTSSNTSGTLAVTDNDRVVIVGASLAGLRAAEELRREGFGGQLTLIGDEPYEPYDRPPLSKHVLSGWLPADHTPLARFQDLRARWQLGVPATALNLSLREVLLADGQRIGFDRLLITTGTRARPWPHREQAFLDGVFSIRGLDDARDLRQRLADRPNRVLVIGGGFIGSEVASVCRELDLSVTVVERSATPLFGSLGSTVGAIAAGMQRQHGVDLRTELTVTALEGDSQDKLCRARLSDGSVVDADVAIVALGSLRNTEWLLSSGLLADGRGMTCDSYCRALLTDGSVAEGIFAAGDVARWPHPLYDGQYIAVEHWGNAVAQAEAAAYNLLHEPAQHRVYSALPTFWSSQFDVNIKSVGLPDMGDEVMITQGSLEEWRFVAAYGRAGRLVAAVSFNAARWLPGYEAMIEAGEAFPPRLYASDQPAEIQPVPAGFPSVNRHTQAVVK